MEYFEYKLILNNHSFTKAILTSEKLGGFKHRQSNGFDGEVWDVFISSLGVVISMIELILQCYIIRKEHVADGKDEDENTGITIIGPDGFEFRNVPIDKVSELLTILENRERDN